MASLDPKRFVGLGFVASFWNADPVVIKQQGNVVGLAVQFAFGDQPSTRADEIPAWAQRCKQAGLKVAGWAWCAATDNIGAANEARYHCDQAAALGFTDFIANAEESYDAHGDSGSPKYHMCDTYVQAFMSRAAQTGAAFTALGQTSTPLFASSANAANAAGWVGMGQAFPLENHATVADVVEHWQSWGWPASRQRPLVQVYETNGQRPGAAEYLADCAQYDVGAVPYIVEQAQDQSGLALMQNLRPATFRLPHNDTPGGEVAGVRTEVDAAWRAFEESTVPNNWRRDNPGEYNAIKHYYGSATAPEPNAIQTKFGQGLLALVNAGKYGDGTHP